MTNNYIQTSAWLNDQTIIYSYWTDNIFLEDFSSVAPATEIPTYKHDHSGFFLLILGANTAPYLVSYTKDKKLKFASLINGMLCNSIQTPMPEKLGPPTAGLWSKSRPDCVYLGHVNNSISIWEITPTGLAFNYSRRLNLLRRLTISRNNPEIRALQECPDGKILIAGEQGIISVFDPCTNELLLQHDYNPNVRMGMNDLCFDAEHQLLFGTCCIANCGEAQLYLWRVHKDEGRYSLKLICTQHFPKQTVGYNYANRCRVLNFAGQRYFLLSISDGTVRVAKIDIQVDSVSLDWIKCIPLEVEGGAEMAFSPHQQHVALGIKKMHLLKASDLIN